MFDFKLIDNKIELNNFKREILDLFRICFNEDLDEDIWNWAYMDNVIGDPVVSLCFDGEKLIGHYAVIPIVLQKQDAEIKACLSMHTMVKPHYRKYGIFVKQAEGVYERAKKLGFQLVVGFPNKNSTPGFKKRLSWSIGPADYVALVTKERLLNTKRFHDYLQDKNLLKLNLANKEFFTWRLSKPSQTYYVKDGTILKDFKNCQDVVFISEGFERNLEEQKQYNVLIDADINDFRDAMVFEYQFGFRLFDEGLRGIGFKKDLLMSDVF